MAARQRPCNTVAGAPRRGRGPGKYGEAGSAKGGAPRAGGHACWRYRIPRAPGPAGRQQTEDFTRRSGPRPRIRCCSSATSVCPPRVGRRHKACKILLDEGLQRDGGINYGIWAKWLRRGETCITGMILSILSYFEYDDDRLDTIADHLLEQQMPDGGWNCQRPQGATHSSVHTTISALEGLRFYELHRKRKLRSGAGRTEARP